MSFESRMLQVLLVIIHESSTVLWGQCDTCNYFYFRNHNQLLFAKIWIEVSHFSFIFVYRLSDWHWFGTLFADQQSVIVEVFARRISIVIVVVACRAVANIIDFIALRRVLPSSLSSHPVACCAVTIVIDDSSFQWRQQIRLKMQWNWDLVLLALSTEMTHSQT